MTNEQTVIFCVYLPTESSRYGLENEQVLNTLTIEVYKYCEADTIIVCGDFNVRIGNKCDAIDSEVIRKSIDTVSNSQGQKLITFVNDIKGCIVNGRVTSHLDDFTSCTAHKGKAVIDYHMVRQPDLVNVRHMEVLSCVELVNRLNLQTLVSNECCIPDHNMLTMYVEMSHVVREGLLDLNLGNKVNNVNFSRIRRKVGENYMNTDVAQRLLGEMIDNVAHCDFNDQSVVNESYEQLTQFIFDQVDDSCKDKGKK